MKTFLQFVEAASWMNAASDNSNSSNNNSTKLSGYAQKALEATQKAAGNNWDSIKDKYTKTLTVVDNVLTNNLKQTVADTLKVTGANMDTLVAKLADMTMNVQQFGDKLGEQVTSFIDDTSGKGVQSMTPIVSLMCSALEANKVGLKPNDMVTLINTISKN